MMIANILLAAACAVGSEVLEPPTATPASTTSRFLRAGGRHGDGLVI
ncbi:MAG: hypothetical protein J5727_06110 [Kiritimatiellae bacterium]|nr:hypothetical protein [Kiritimatiellia bacterium]